MGLIKITDSINTTNSEIAASATAVKTVADMISSSSGNKGDIIHLDGVNGPSSITIDNANIILFTIYNYDIYYFSDTYPSTPIADSYWGYTVDGTFGIYYKSYNTVFQYGNARGYSLNSDFIDTSNNIDYIKFYKSTEGKVQGIATCYSDDNNNWQDGMSSTGVSEISIGQFNGNTFTLNNLNSGYNSAIRQSCDFGYVILG